ncbi:MAG: AEC family transporter [Bacillota bacterium]|nr:AEC family transporter [Bacillota bacterium]
MEALRFSFTAIFPIVILMALGFFLGRIGLIRQQLIDDSTKLLFNVAIPVLVFVDLMESEIGASFDPRLMLFAVLGLLVVALLLRLIVPRFIPEPPAVATFVQGCFRANIIILGIPIISNICGSLAATRLAMVASVIGPLYGIVAVFIFASCMGGGPDGKQRLGPKAILKLIFTNPVVIGCLAGMLASIINLEAYMPHVISETLDELSAMVLPLSLLVQGAGIRFQGEGQCLRRSLAAALIKVLLLPILALLIAWLLGFRGMDLAVLMVLFGAPASVSSFAMAHQMGGDHRMASMIVVFSNVLCIFTIFAFVFFLRLMGQI